MANPRSKGARIERELARKLWSRGAAVIRGPASGSGARHLFYPDLVAIKNRDIAVIEVKYRRNGPVQLDIEKLYKLIDFAKRAGGKAYLAVKIQGEWRIIEIDESILTKRRRSTKYVTISIEDIMQRGLTLEAFALKLGSRDITSYIQPGKFSSPNPHGSNSSHKG